MPGEIVATNAVSAYWNTISTLYALLFASGATSDSQLNIYCAHAPNYVKSLNLMVSTLYLPSNHVTKGAYD